MILYPLLPLLPCFRQVNPNGDPSREINYVGTSVHACTLNDAYPYLPPPTSLLYITFPSTSCRRLTLRFEETFSILCNNSLGKLACLNPSF